MTQLKSNYIILKDYNLLIECHSGNLDSKSYIDFVKRTTLDPLFSNNMNYYIDLSNVVVTASIDDIIIYNNFINDNFQCDKKRRVALLTSSPNQMVFATLFKNSNTQKLKEVEVFSTKENALNWINSRLNKEEILNIFSGIQEYSAK